ncbi:carboxypeptidase B isoform X1 [Penaeus vannamei]|uniref:carboxypeptidase B isoform X1 n=1 Tax=Penaeus vannamei TaxID=6689 RepID=UPI00387F6A2A
MKLFSASLLCFLVSWVTCASAGRYEGFQVLRVSPRKDVETKLLERMEQEGYLDVFRRGRDGSVDVLVDKAKAKLLADFGLKSDTLLSDVDRLVENQMRGRGQVRYGNVTWDRYNTLEEIYDYMDHIASEHPDVATVFSLGKTWEGRDIKALRLTRDGDEDTKPIVFLDAGFHAREWIAPAVASYTFHSLMHDATGLLSSAVWVVAPSMNPDGYEYTWTGDRLWRKTRSNRTSVCKGVDPNRNFDFHWMEVGASDNPCSEIYAGPSALSEPETMALADYMEAHRGRVKAYLTLHSYSQLFMYPFGHTLDLPEDWEELDRVAKLAVEALTAVHGTEYEYGSCSSILYLDAGSSRDYVKGVVEVPYVYTIELRDQGYYGFLLPPEQILPTCEETWEAIRVAAKEALAL